MVQVIFSIFVGCSLIIGVIAWFTPVNTSEAMARAEAENGN